MNEQTYSYERRRGTISIYNGEGTKIAEVCGPVENRLENARDIVNSLNMRDRWLKEKMKKK